MIEGIHVAHKVGNRLAAADGKIEQGTDKPAVVVLSTARHASIDEPFLDIDGGNAGNGHGKGLGKLPQSKPELLGIGRTDADRCLNGEQFIKDFLHGLARETCGMTGQVEPDAFRQGDVVRKGFDRLQVVCDCRAEVGIAFPFPEFLARVDIGDPVHPRKFEDLAFAVGQVDQDVPGFALGIGEAAELLPDAARDYPARSIGCFGLLFGAVVVDQDELIIDLAGGLPFTRFRVSSTGGIGDAIDGGRRVPFFEHPRKLALPATGDVRLHAKTVPLLSR